MHRPDMTGNVLKGALNPIQKQKSRLMQEGETKLSFLLLGNLKLLKLYSQSYKIEVQQQFSFATLLFLGFLDTYDTKGLAEILVVCMIV